MTHLSDDELVLMFYREGDILAEADAHVAACAGCRGRLEQLATALREVESAPVPDRDDSYGARVWARLQPRLEAERHQRPWWYAVAAAITWPRLAAGSAVAALLVAAFVAGRSSVERAPHCATTSTRARSTSFAMRFASPQT